MPVFCIIHNERQISSSIHVDNEAGDKNYAAGVSLREMKEGKSSITHKSLLRQSSWGDNIHAIAVPKNEARIFGCKGRYAVAFIGVPSYFCAVATV